MVVPQGMSYAQNLAFLPQVYGLVRVGTACVATLALHWTQRCMHARDTV